MKKEAPVMPSDKGTDPAHCLAPHSHTDRKSLWQRDGRIGIPRAMLSRSSTGREREVWADCVLPQQIAHRAQHTESNHALN